MPAGLSMPYPAKLAPVAQRTPSFGLKPDKLSRPSMTPMMMLAFWSAIADNVTWWACMVRRRWMAFA